MVVALEEARLQGAGVKDGYFDDRSAITSYRAAFRAYGVDVDTSAESEIVATLNTVSI